LSAHSHLIVASGLFTRANLGQSADNTLMQIKAPLDKNANLSPPSGYTG
jgi:hypothetical protein